MGYFCCNADAAAVAESISTTTSWEQYHKPSLVTREFSYSLLESATNHFSPANFLGKGSHGSVYRAVLENGTVVAVKRTNSDNEFHIVSKLPRNSRHVVNLVGFCTNKNKKVLLIVFEFMPNGSLFDLLHSNPRPPGWSRRVRLALQVAKAVGFLHASDPPVIHRDIKSSNVLLDSNGRPRIGDFGLALLIGAGHVDDVPPAGTLGYLDPSYLSPSDLSTKSDVFSFGILLLEIITGRNAIDLNFSPPSLVDWAIPIITRGEFHRILDRRIASPEDLAVINQLAVLAAKCVRTVAGKRPAMTEVVESLKIADKKIRSPIWNNLSGCISTKAGPLMGSSEETKSTREKKVSSVAINNEALNRHPIIIGRSKSLRRKPVVKLLSKSRSMGMLKNSKGGVVLVQIKESEECKLIVGEFGSTSF